MTHASPVAPAVHGTPAPAQGSVVAKRTALTSMELSCATTSAQLSGSRDARTETVPGAPSTHTHVCAPTMVAPEPASLGFHWSVPVGRTIELAANRARASGSNRI